MNNPPSTTEQRITFVGVAWPYANGSLHAGHIAGAYLPADIFARYSRMNGDAVLFVSGSDAHGTPITLRADSLGQAPAVVAETYHREFCKNWADLGISFDLYTTTMTDNHRGVVQDQFRALLEHGLLVEQEVGALYDEISGRFLPDRYVIGTCPRCGYVDTRGDQCEGCGRPFEASDLINPRSIVTNNPVEMRATSHFYLDLPALQDRLASWVDTRTHWRPHVIGETRKFLNEGLQARAITRNLDWGVPIPVDGYEDRRIYVWFEAVTGYLSASIEWAAQTGQPDAWRTWWEHGDARQYYFLGKDNIVFHTLIWPALLMGRGDLPQLPYDVPANCFLNFSGKKASKSGGVGFLINDLLDEYGADTVRFYLAATMPEFTDSSFDLDDMVARVNGELIGTWGNLINRAFALVEQQLGGVAPEVHIDHEVRTACTEAWQEYREFLDATEFRRALRRALKLAQFANAYMNAHAPWSATKTRPDVEQTLGSVLYMINTLKCLFAPYIPFSMAELHERLGYTDDVISHGFRWEPIAANTRLERGASLFRKLG